MSLGAISYFRSLPTKLDLNGPTLSFIQNPVGVSTIHTGSATFVGIATVGFTSVTNPVNSGTIAYQWYEVGAGKVSNGTNVTGAATTTLTLSDLRTPGDDGREFFLEAKYIASSETGNAVNSPINSGIATVDVFPLIITTEQPRNITTIPNLQQTFKVEAEASAGRFTTGLEYQWFINGELANDGKIEITSVGEFTALYSTDQTVDIPDTATDIRFTVAGGGGAQGGSDGREGGKGGKGRVGVVSYFPKVDDDRTVEVWIGRRASGRIQGLSRVANGSFGGFQGYFGNSGDGGGGGGATGVYLPRNKNLLVVSGGGGGGGGASWDVGAEDGQDAGAFRGEAGSPATGGDGPGQFQNRGNFDGGGGGGGGGGALTGSGGRRGQDRSFKATGGGGGGSVYNTNFTELLEEGTNDGEGYVNVFYKGTPPPIISIRDNSTNNVEEVDISNISDFTNFQTGRTYTLTSNTSAEIAFQLRGAGGGNSYRARDERTGAIVPGPGGPGGGAYGTLRISKDTELTLVVGGKGANNTGGRASGGYNGGGTGYNALGGGGGGYTGIFEGTIISQDTALMIAGGGGGGANDPGVGGMGGGAAVIPSESFRQPGAKIQDVSCVEGDNLADGGPGLQNGNPCRGTFLQNAQRAGRGGLITGGGAKGVPSSNDALGIPSASSDGSALRGGDGGGGGGAGYFGGGGGAVSRATANPADGAGGGGSGYIDVEKVIDNGFEVDSTWFTDRGGINQDGGIRMVFLSTPPTAVTTLRVSGTKTDTLTIEGDSVGLTTVSCRVKNNLASNSPQFTSAANFAVVNTDQLFNINVESIVNGRSEADISTINLYNGDFELDVSNNIDYFSIYAADKDINVEMELYGGKGADYPTTNIPGGEGGYAKIRFLMRKGQEYVIAGLSPTINTPYVYEGGQLIAVVGGGGDSVGSRFSEGGAGGDGGGSGPGDRGTGRNPGRGGSLESLTLNGVFGSAFGDAIVLSGDTLATAPNGGRTVTCPKGASGAFRLTAPCEPFITGPRVIDVDLSRFNTAELTDASGASTRTLVENTAILASRGYKSGYSIIETAGAGINGGGRGGNGATGGQGGLEGSGGGGGSGYISGSVNLIDSTLGGSTGPAKVIIRTTVNTDPLSNLFRDSQGRILILSCATAGLDPRRLTQTTDIVNQGTNTCIDDVRWQAIIELARLNDGYRLTATRDRSDRSVTRITNATSNNIVRMINANRLPLRNSLLGWNETPGAGGSSSLDLAWDESSGSSQTGVDYSMLHWTPSNNFGYYGWSSNPFFTPTSYGHPTANWWILPPGVPDF